MSSWPIGLLCKCPQGQPAEMITDRWPALARNIVDQVPASDHETTQCANNRIGNDHRRLEARLRPMQGLKRDRTASSQRLAERVAELASAAMTRAFLRGR